MRLETNAIRINALTFAHSSESPVAGIVGSFPALNARPKEKLDEWLIQIKTELAEVPQYQEQ